MVETKEQNKPFLKSQVGQGPTVGYIEYAPPKMYLDAIKTFPRDTNYLHAQFRAEGIKDGNRHYAAPTKEDEKYVALCNKHKVIPHLIVKLDFDNESGVFVPRHHPSNTNRMPAFNKKSMRNYISGGRAHYIEITENSEEAFDTFINDLLPALLKEGYQTHLIYIGGDNGREIPFWYNGPLRHGFEKISVTVGQNDEKSSWLENICKRHSVEVNQFTYFNGRTLFRH